MKNRLKITPPPSIRKSTRSLYVTFLAFCAFASCDLMTTEKASVRPSVPTGRILLDNNHITMRPGEIRELKATVFPMLAYDKTNLTPNEIQNAAILSMLITDKTEWCSSDAEIASVDENGIVTALKEGACKITVKSGEAEFACDVLVDFQKKADEEFLEYVERIGAYTELPLGTDGSAGPTAQYVTFGFTADVNYTHSKTKLHDEHSEIAYNHNQYAKIKDEWYQYENYVSNYYYKVIPEKWWLCDKEKGLMFLESKRLSQSYFADFANSIEVEDENGIYPFYYQEQTKSALKEITTLCDYETSYLRACIDGGQYFSYVTWVYSDYSLAYIKPREQDFSLQITHLYRNKTERQLAQIKQVDLDCGEGGHTKGRMFIPSEEEIKTYFPNDYKISLDYSSNYNYSNTYILTRTRKKIDGKNKLFAVRLNEAGIFTEFTYIDGYTLLLLDKSDRHQRGHYFIPAICVAPAPHK